MRLSKCIITILACFGIVAFDIFYFNDNSHIAAESKEIYWHAITCTENLDLPFIVESASWPAFTKQELMERAVLVVRGQAVGRSAPFRVESNDGPRTVFTDYYIRIHEV